MITCTFTPESQSLVAAFPTAMQVSLYDVACADVAFHNSGGEVAVSDVMAAAHKLHCDMTLARIRTGESSPEYSVCLNHPRYNIIRVPAADAAAARELAAALAAVVPAEYEVIAVRFDGVASYAA